MKSYTNKLFLADNKKHSKVFKPTDSSNEGTIASSVYIMNGVIPVGATECKITVSWPKGGQDEAYLKV